MGLPDATLTIALGALRSFRELSLWPVVAGRGPASQEGIRAPGPVAAGGGASATGALEMPAALAEALAMRPPLQLRIAVVQVPVATAVRNGLICCAPIPSCVARTACAAA